MKYQIDEETVFKKVTTNGDSRYAQRIYYGNFRLISLNGVVLATNGNHVIPLSNIRCLQKELDPCETRRCRKPRIYKPEADSEDS